MRIFRLIVIIVFVTCLGLSVGTGIWDKCRNDKTIPEIHTDEVVLNLSVSDPPEKLLEGLTAMDEKDGDITDSIMVSGTSYFLEKGEITVKYVVFDSDNNFGSLSRKVKYTDYHSPEFSLSQPLIFTRNTNNVSILDHVQAVDQLDGDITDKIKMSGNGIDVKSAGVYPITLEVTNSYGDRTEVETNVVVQDSGLSGSIILSDYLIYIDRDSEFEAGDYVESVISSGKEQLKTEGLQVYDGNSPICDINVNGDVDTAIPGCYQLEYTFKTSRSEGSAWLTVVVRE